MPTSPAWRPIRSTTDDTVNGDAEPIVLSIVVGVRPSEVDPTPCLASITAQLRPGVELIVAGDVEGRWANTEGVSSLGSDGLVPQLWAKGLEVARGPLVALTAGSVVPEPDWVDRLLSIKDRSAAVVGGAIEPSRWLKPLDWAVYFCRYTPYMLPLPSDGTTEIPGDNAVYRREVLDEYRELYTDGFWEPFIHRVLREAGHVLALDPDLVVRQAPGMSFDGFLRQRFRHGVAHGQMRSRGLSRLRILTEALTLPLVPPLMVLRAGRNVMGRRRHLPRFFASIPMLTLFTTSWALGEFVGRLRAVTGKP